MLDLLHTFRVRVSSLTAAALAAVLLLLPATTSRPEAVQQQSSVCPLRANVNSETGDGCTALGAGREATVDGSVITSQSDSCSECRVHVVPGRSFPKGATAPVHWGMIYSGADDPQGGRALGDYGTVIGQVPQVERTYTYFHTGYPQINEHQVAIGESTCSQRRELQVPYVEGVTEQIMTIEQAQVFALQRARTAREALSVVTSLVETYGFLPSMTGAESLTIADPREVWVLEIFSVGSEWRKASGKPGAIWAARRVPDDHVVVTPNYVRIREIDPKDPDTKVSPNYMQEAIDRGWFDPKSGKPFIWQEAYAPPISEGSLNRLWLIYSTLAPSLKQWPDRRVTGIASPARLASQIEGAAFYPFSVKPEKKIAVQDVIAFQRSTFEGTAYDVTLDRAWFVADGNGGMAKSPLATPFPSRELQDLLRLTPHRTIAQQGYGMVAHLRGWLPPAIGGVYWFYVDNPFVSTYVPIYAGVTDVAEAYKRYDARVFDDQSARWNVDVIENLMQLKFGPMVKELHAAREPLERDFFASQASVEEKALALHKTNPAAAAAYLTDVTRDRMDRTVKMYQDLRRTFFTKFLNSRY